MYYREHRAALFTLMRGPVMGWSEEVLVEDNFSISLGMFCGLEKIEEVTPRLEARLENINNYSRGAE